MGKILLYAIATIGLLAGLPAQQRIFINGSPTNMLADWSQISSMPDSTAPNTFLAFMPISAVSSWAVWEPDITIDANFGPGNWIRVRIEATYCASLSPDTCAHQSAAGTTAPMSLLTSSYDFGAYSGVNGTPLFAGATIFPSSPIAYVEGLPAFAGWTFERWQLRTRGFWPNEPWNACQTASTVTPNFTGYLGARFTFTLL